MKRQSMTSEEERRIAESEEPFEDARPMSLRPQVMPNAEGVKLKPRTRDQALPEKEDDRFFDRWVVDKARALGSRAVKQPAVDKLIKTVRAFAEWRSLRHGPAAESESLADKELVASTPERIKHAKAEAEQLDTSAEEVESEAAQQEREVDEVEEKISGLRPALRGSPWDFPLVVLANLVVFGVDFFIIQIALETVPGTAEQHRLTAIGLGAGAVLVGDVLGWMTAIGSIRRDGALRRPAPPVIALVAGLLLLAVWFFGELGDFREFGLAAAAEADGPEFGEPVFFTIAQILFLLAAAAACFAYVGRRTGRELHDAREDVRGRRDKLKDEAKSLRQRAMRARQVAAEAPARCLAAEERIRQRERIAKGRARHDLKQGEYLASLVVPEYMHERAGVESGIGSWQLEARGAKGSLLGLAPGVLLVLATLGTLVAGGLAYLIVGSVPIAILSAAIVAFALGIALTSDEDHESGRPWRYVARLVASARKSEQRATDIERLTPFADGHGMQNGNGRSRNGNGRQLTCDEYEARYERLKEIFDDEDG